MKPRNFIGKIILVALLLLAIAPSLLAQQGTPNVQDCLGAIPVCQPVYTTTSSYTGHGNVYPEIHANSVCPLCMDGEKNDVFYVITVQTSGILRFTLTPNNPSNDYDWSLFNMTNAPCSQLYTNAQELQVSCNSYGVTGTNGPTGISTALGNNLNCNGPGVSGKKFNKDLDVLAGQTYLLNVSNWSATNQSGYTLDFSGSTASIFDVTPPVIDSIQSTVSCAGSDTLYVHFSENVQCIDVHNQPSKFSLAGPAGTYTLTDVTSPDCDGGAANGRTIYLHVTPPLGPGAYTLSIIGDIHDLCDNTCQYTGYPFTLTEINAPSAAAGNDTTVANGAIVTLHGNATGGAPPYTFHWEPAALVQNANIAQPLTVNMGASAEFTLSITDNAGCHGTDQVVVTVVGGPLAVMASADPQVLCVGASATLGALVSGGSGNYSYAWSSNPPGFTSTLANPVVFPLASTVYTVHVNDGFSTTTGTVSVHVNPKPVANAGSPMNIPYGTNAQLSGSGSGGTGNYLWHWTSSPPGFSSNQPNPLFVNLATSTLFTLVVTDNTTGCVSEPATVMVTVTGSPLSCTPVAEPQIVCKGVGTVLHAMAGGGSGSYGYAWSSIPAGFTSTDPNPPVTPDETTTYLLTVTDGFNSASGAVNVQVKPLPVFTTGWPHDTTACIYDRLTLDAGNPGGTYYWSNGATTRTLEVGTTGIGYDEQRYRVRVTGANGCVDSAGIIVVFTFSACEAIAEHTPDGLIALWPNPVTAGILHLEITLPVPAVEITVTDVVGAILYTERLSTSGIAPFVKDVEVSFLPAGLYLVSLKCEGYAGVVKFVRR